MKGWICLAVSGLLSACSTFDPPHDPSASRHIDETLRQAAMPRPAAALPAASAASVAMPEAVGHSLLPPLRDTMGVPAPSGPPEPRFNFAVSDAPVGQVLQSLASDTRYSILLSPRHVVPTVGPSPDPAARAAAEAAASRRDLITLQLKNVTVMEALEALRETYGYEFNVVGTRIYVEPPELQTRFYQVNYTLVQRRGVSDLQVVSGAAAGGGGSGGSGGGSGSGGSSGGSSSGGSGGGGASYGSSQASAMSTMTKSDLWTEVEDSLRTLLGCQIPKLSAGRSGQVSSSSGSGQGASSNRADVSFVGETQPGERLRGVDGCEDGRAVTVNPMSGTVLVRGMPRELRIVERLLKVMQLNVERQVIIEAKVIDVQLNRDAQQGINWAAFNHGALRASLGAAPTLVGAPGTAGAGNVLAGSTLADLLGQGLVSSTNPASAFAAGVGIALQSSKFAALIGFLESQGDVHVLSSPRIATLNNQKAVIKVGTEEPFITAIAPGSTSLSSSAAIAVPPTLTYEPFFSGISLDVTPQIDERDQVTLHVHALVNSITEKQKASSTQPGATPVPLAVSTVNETDSVVKTGDGMMIVIGGLMMDSTTQNRAAVPGVGDVPIAGSLFRKGDQTSSKRELVILIRPTVVKMDSTWSDDIASTGRRIQEMR